MLGPLVSSRRIAEAGNRTRESPVMVSRASCGGLPPDASRPLPIRKGSTSDRSTSSLARRPPLAPRRVGRRGPRTSRTAAASTQASAPDHAAPAPPEFQRPNDDETRGSRVSFSKRAVTEDLTRPGGSQPVRKTAATRREPPCGGAKLGPACKFAVSGSSGCTPHPPDRRRRRADVAREDNAGWSLYAAPR